MAISINEGNEVNIGKPDEWLLDKFLMQNLQDRFCDANNVYMICLAAQEGVITEVYGSKEELLYLDSMADIRYYALRLRKMIENSIESVMEAPLDTDCMKICASAIRVSGETAAVWLVIGVMDEKDGEIPSYVMRTSPERYYKSLEFLESLSKQICAVKMEEILAQEAFLKSRESETQMRAELHRNEATAAILKMLESENSFQEITKDILKETCDYLDIASGVLLKEIPGKRSVDSFCGYIKEGSMPSLFLEQETQKEQLPFFNGKPYMISYGSMMPETFLRLFKENGLTAAVFLPVEANGQSSMYLCFLEYGKKRKWEMSDIKFMNDVKRILQTILTKRITKNSLISSYTSLEAILENVGCAIYVKDPNTGNILYANEKYKKYFKKTLEELAVSPEQRNRDMAESKKDFFEEIYSAKEHRWFHYCCTKIQWVDGRDVSLCTIYDVTEKKRYEQKIEKQANNDFLTGLYNRMKCEQDLQRYIGEAEQCGGEGALLYIDLDDFKHINDGLGHQYGDILLKNVSACFKKIAGVGDHCYRMGGDEFIIIITYRQYHLLSAVLDEIKELFSKPWRLKGAEYYCTMSMGIVHFPTDGNTVDELIQKADIAMYDAKCSGKNRMAFYDENVMSTSFKRLDMEKNMRNATKNKFDEFEVYFQPIVDILKPGTPCMGAEALIRWNSKELGSISPTEFIPLAEYLGLINPIGGFILKEACIHCKYWNDMGHPDYKVNVNLSVIQLLQNDIVEQIGKTIEETGINPGNLTLEVTESLAINDMNRMKKILAEIKKLGVRVALDDFGTGYSSLNHIREMPIDVIKIDRCFIMDIGKDDFSDAFVKMVAELASAIGVTVCVEGVETAEQLGFLMDGKIRLIQGYYFGKPMNAAAFERRYV